MLEAAGLVCVRGERTLFRDVSFQLDAHGLMHIAGANGSGKTSLLRIVCGLGAVDAGEVRWQGEPIRALREHYWRELVYIGHANALKDDLTPVENLALVCQLAGQPATTPALRDALAQRGLASCLHLPVRALSQGQKRRSVLARLALAQQARLWILDEPFAALDTHAVAQLEALILAYVDGGGSVMFTTHQDGATATRVTQRLDLTSHEGAAC